MIRRTTVIGLVLAVLAGVWMFVVKHRIHSLEAELKRIERTIVAEQEAIHVLTAEWSYLNQPARLDGLARRLIGLAPLSAEQMTDLGGLALALEASELDAEGGEADTVKPEPKPKRATPPPPLPDTGLRVEAVARQGD
jgi:hypothetical protein